MARRGLERLLVSCSLATSVALSGCTTEPEPEVGEIDLPAAMRLAATAAGAAGGRHIECALNFLIDLTADGSLEGRWGGEVLRSSLLDDGSGIQFWADAASDLRIEPMAGRRVRLVSYANGRPLEPSHESRFWDGILTLEGEYDPATHTMAGDWTCHPMDTRGDDVGSVVGSWTVSAR